MSSSGMLRRVALVSEECIASNIRMTRIGELGTTLAITSNRRTLRRNTVGRTKATRCNIPEDGILHSHRLEHLSSYRLICPNRSVPTAYPGPISQSIDRGSSSNEAALLVRGTAPRYRFPVRRVCVCVSTAFNEPERDCDVTPYSLVGVCPTTWCDLTRGSFLTVTP
jgi:hypothetical protein